MDFHGSVLLNPAPLRVSFYPDLKSITSFQSWSEIWIHTMSDVVHTLGGFDLITASSLETHSSSTHLHFLMSALRLGLGAVQVQCLAQGLFSWQMQLRSPLSHQWIATDIMTRTGLVTFSLPDWHLLCAALVWAYILDLQLFLIYVQGPEILLL